MQQELSGQRAIRILELVPYMPLANLASKFIDKNASVATAERRRTYLLREIHSSQQSPNRP